MQLKGNAQIKENVPAFVFEGGVFSFQGIKPDISLIGSKALNLSFLSSLGYVDVPKWASVTSTIFREVVRRSPELQKELEELYVLTEKYSGAQDRESLQTEVFKKAAVLRTKIEEHVLPEDLTKASAQVFNQVSLEGKVAVAVRSSAMTEDLPGASFAGLYDSFLNIRDQQAFLDGLKKVWASTFNDRAVQYYMQKGLSLRDVFMSVVVMELVPTETSGTVFTTDVTTGYSGLHIMASTGLEGVVGGDISADSFLLHPDNLLILKRVRGSKAFRYVPNADGSGLTKVAVPGGGSKYCITTDKAKELAHIAKRIGEDYQRISPGPIDTEFAMTKEGKIFFVQVRPVVMTGISQVDDIDFSALGQTKLKSIATGKHSVFGVKHGRVKIIDDFHDLESGKMKIEADDIVVTTRTENQWTQYLSQFSGIITTEGNPTSHPVLISRERGVPCLVGVADAVAKFKALDGQFITVDGFRKCVYEGLQPLKKVSIDKIAEAFKVVEEERLQDEEEMVKDLFLKKFMVEQGGKQWITGITSSFSGALLDMVTNAYKLRGHVVNQSGINPPIKLDTAQLVVPGKQGDGAVYDHWWATHVDQLKVCRDMNLGNCLRFYDDKEKKMRELVQICKDFDLTLASWKNVRRVYEEMTAYQLLGFLERYPLIHSTYEYAKQLGIPRLFFEEYAAVVPEYELEEDTEFLNATKRLATHLLEAAAAQGKPVMEIDVNWAKEQLPNFYADLVAFSREYKFLKTEDWADAPPVEKAFGKVMDQVKAKDLDIVAKKKYAEAEEEFFVDNPELRERIRLSIVKKLQQNNIHHVRPRAQWYLRDKLLVLGASLVGQGILKTPEEILTVPLERLEGYIAEYEKT